MSPKQAGLLRDRPRWGSGCTFIDYDRNGQLDLFVANYLEFDFKTVPPPGRNSFCNWKGIPVFCGPRGLPPGIGSLYRNNGDGTFTDVSDASGIAKAKGSYMMTAVAADFNNDGWPDIYVACDSTPSFLFRNNRDGTFTEIGLESGVALNEDGNPQAGMGVGIGDYNLDGHLDIFKTHFSDDTNILYRNDGKAILRRRDHRHRTWRRDALRRLGRGHRRPRQRRPARPVPGDRQHLPGSRRETAGLSDEDAARDLPQSWATASSRS